MNIVDAARRIALLSIVSPDWDSFRRKVCRFYSSKFNVPLPQVEYDLDFFEVLLHYFESIFEDLDPRGKQEQLKLAVETDEERTKRQAQEDLEEAEFLEEAIKEEKERIVKNIDFREMAQKVKKDAEIKKIADEEINVTFEKELDLDKPAF